MQTPFQPVIKTTRYDLVTAALIAGFLFLLASVSTIVAAWFFLRIPEPGGSVPEISVLPIKNHDHRAEQQLSVESPDVTAASDPSMAAPKNENVSQNELENILDAVNQSAVADNTEQGQADGTGDGIPGDGNDSIGASKPGGAIEQRWFIQFEDADLAQYARQLDFFNIELGVIQPEGRLIYCNDLSEAKIKTRSVESGESEQRLSFNWQSGAGQKADLALFKKAGIDAKDGIILHFYPPELEQTLARIETDFANRKPENIRRTYFKVRPSGNGFAFYVTRQLYRE